MEDTLPRLLAVFTGASSGLAFQLARLTLMQEDDLAIAGDQLFIVKRADALQRAGAKTKEAVLI